METGDYMNHNIIGAAVTAAIGLLVAMVNYFISKNILTRAPEKYSFATVARQILQIGYLAAVYFAGTRITYADSTYLLVGAVAGMTIPMLFFTKKLLLVNKSASAVKNEKGDDADG